MPSPKLDRPRFPTLVRSGGFVRAQAAALATASLVVSTGGFARGEPELPVHAAYLVADGVPYPIPLPLVSLKGVVRADGVTIADPAGGWRVRLSLEMDPDPAISYSMDVTDEGAPSSFAFSFQQLIIPTAAPGTATHQHSSRATDGGSDGVSVTAVAPPAGVPQDPDGVAEIDVYTLSTNGGVTLINPGLDLGPSFVYGTSGGSQGPFFESAVGPAATGSYDFMRADVSFSLSGGGDQYSFSGVATIAACGNGVLEEGEQCDDGNTVDGDGCSSDCQAVENHSPRCDAAQATPAQVWPPNGKMVAIGVTGVTDPDGDPVSVRIDTIAQDEPVRLIGIGSGNTCPDGDGIGTATARVRAERAGNPKVPGDGRVYHVNFTASDGMGGRCSGEVRVCVPHDQRPGNACTDQGALFDSTTCN